MRIESDIIKTAVIIALLGGVYSVGVFWPSKQQSQALAQEIQGKQADLAQTAIPELEPVREQIHSLRAELRDRAVVLPKGDLHDRLLKHVSDTLLRHHITLYESSYREAKAYKRFSVTPIDVQFKTDFTNAFSVIKQIENAGPPVRIERLDITSNGQDAAGVVEVTIELSSFFEPTARQGGQR